MVGKLNILGYTTAAILWLALRIAATVASMSRAKGVPFLIGSLLAVLAQSSAAAGLVTDCDELARNPGPCSEMLARYRQMCQVSEEAEFCGFIRTQLASCGLDLTQLPAVSPAARPRTVAEFLQASLLETEGVQVGMSVCEARSILLADGFEESPQCTFRKSYGTGGNRRSQITLLPGATALLAGGGHMFQQAPGWRCMGTVTGIEYRPLIEDALSLTDGEFFDAVAARFGAPGECGQLYDYIATDPSIRSGGNCSFPAVPASETVGAAQVRKSSSGSIKVGLLSGSADAPQSTAGAAAGPVAPVDALAVPGSRLASGETPAAPGDEKRVSILLNQAGYTPGEPIEVSVSGLSGSSTDWLTLVKADAPTNTWGEWTYTQGVTSGNWSFRAPAQPGSYEIRVYLDYPRGGFDVVARATVTVAN